MKKAVMSDFDERGRGVAVDISSETERERSSLDRNKKGRVFQERAVDLNTRSGQIMGSRSDQNGMGFNDDNRRPSRVPIDNWVRGNDGDFNMNGPNYVNSGLSNKHEEIRHRFGSPRPQPDRDQRNTEINGSNAFRGDARGISEHGRYTTSTYPDEGPSNYLPSSFYGYDENIRSHDGLHRLASVENLENDRAELLRKLDELTVQLSRSERTKEPVAIDRNVVRPLVDSRGGHKTFEPGGSSSLYNVNTRAPQENNASNMPYHDGRDPYVKNHDLDRQEFYRPPINVPNGIGRYEDAYWPQRRPPHQSSARVYQGQFPEQYMDFNQNSHMLQPHVTFSHPPGCSCFQCYNKNQQRQIPSEVPYTAFRSRQSPSDPTYPMYYNHESPVTYGAQGYNSRGFEPPQLHPRDQRPQMRSASDFDSDNGSFNYHYPRKVVSAGGGGGRVCHPIEGGAPFITCCKCFELLKLPRKNAVMGKYQRKLRCGACSALNLFGHEDRDHLVSVSPQVNKVSAKVGDGFGEMLDMTTQSYPGYLNAGASDDFDRPGYDFQLANTDINSLSGEKWLNFNEAAKKQESHSSSSSFSDTQSPDRVIVQIDVTNSTELPSIDNVPLPLPDSPINERLDFSPSDNVVSSYGQGNKSEQTDHEKVVTQTTSRQNSVKDAPEAIEIEVCSNEYVNSSISHDSTGLTKEKDQPRVNKEGPSLFKGFKRTGIANFSRSSQSIEDKRSNVFVNGHLIQERMVKKAEKLAGPIQPGEYWYDFRAGFWGVMGHPCLGIIPPFIDEFNYPIPESCGAGNTGVFVNGRELHRRDLDLLSSRGLPILSGKSYLVEISGRVLDEDSGEELENLGKLAPTVEKANRGFGMKIPKAIAS